MSERQSPRTESEQGATKLQVVRQSQLGHYYAAYLSTCVHLVLLELDLEAAFGFATVDSSLKEGEEPRQLGFLAALVEVFKEIEDVFIC